MPISVPQNLCILKTLYVCMCITSADILSACNSNSEALIKSSSIAFAMCNIIYLYSTALIINRIQAKEMAYLY